MFTGKDPLDRLVRLKKTTWEFKISPGHPEVNLELLERLIQNPYYILRDLQADGSPHPTREEYVDLIPSPVSQRLVVIRAIVDHGMGEGDIVTAFLSTKTKGLSTEGGIVYARTSFKL